MCSVCLPSSCFTIHPDIKIADLCCCAYHDRFIESLHHLVQEASDVLDLSFDISRLNVSFFDLHRKFTPFVFFLHGVLHDAILADDEEKVREFIRSLDSWLDEEEDIFSGIDIDRVSDIDWEYYITTQCYSALSSDMGHCPEIGHLDSDLLSQARNHIHSALDLLSSCFAPMRFEFDRYTGWIRVFCGQSIMGITNVRMYHCLFLRIPDLGVDPILYYLEHLVHESSHMHLNALMSSDPLVLNDPGARFSSALRPDPRPMLGVYHAMFVLTRIVATFWRLSDIDGRDLVFQHLAESLDELLRSLEEVSRHGRLTDYGKKIVEEGYSLAERCLVSVDWGCFSFSADRIHRYGSGKSEFGMLLRCLDAGVRVHF